MTEAEYEQLVEFLGRHFTEIDRRFDEVIAGSVKCLSICRRSSVRGGVQDAEHSFVNSQDIAARPPGVRRACAEARRVVQQVLARWAEQLELGRWLRLGRGEQLTGGQAKESVLAMALEAVLGVVDLEDGLPGARRAVAALALW